MRNLLEYPVTYEEKQQLLERLAQEFWDEGRFGDMRPLLLRQISEDLARLKGLED